MAKKYMQDIHEFVPLIVDYAIMWKQETYCK